MTPAQNWKTFFKEWPAEFPRSGILLTNLNEASPFKEFWLKDDMLLLERTVPDALGSRFLMLGFEAINSVKFVKPLTEAVIDSSGFATSCPESVTA